MAYETILYELAENILTITLNRPEKLNAFTIPMLKELLDAFDRADADDEVRAIIVTGAGRAFCAGADLSAGGATFDRAARGDRATPPIAPTARPISAMKPRATAADVWRCESFPT
jgi:enoyl-CoA hydratase/carnithine racemase